LIILPFPAKELWPNSRPHWAAKARAAKKARAWAYAATLAAKPLKPEGRVNFIVTIHPRATRTIDTDNAIAAMKGYFDGIADALGVNDNTFNAPVVLFGTPKPGGLVRIEIV
jgi:crossover junction endodeoxyribonuclease RusA